MKSGVIYVSGLLLMLLLLGACTQEKSILDEKQLTLTQSQLFVEIGKSGTVRLDGAGVYSVDVDHPDVLKYNLQGQELVVTGLHEGRAKVSITDVNGLTMPLDVIVGSIGTRTQDSLALIELYATTNPDGWVDKWQVQYPLEYWRGVKLNKEGRVVGLNLMANGLRGKFPKSVCKLFFLQRLNLSMNEFTDEIPSELTNLINLHQLRLEFMNGLSIDPQTIEDLTSLTQLDTLGFIDVTVRGSVPQVFDKFSRLRYLAYGFIGQDRFPIEVCKLKDLRSLELYQGNYGTLPFELSELENLRIFRAGECGLTGEIPKELSHMPNLETLYLSNNQLEGDIPKELTTLKKLKGIYLDNNRLTSIPQDFSGMDSLQYITVSHNNLQGTIPHFGELTKLRYIDLSQNKLTGSLPQDMSRLPALKELHLQKNRLEGEIPESYSTMRSLESLDVHENNLTGTIPEAFANKDPELPFWFDARDNRLSGVLSPNIRGHKHYYDYQWLFMPQQNGYGFAVWAPLNHSNPIIKK